MVTLPSARQAWSAARLRCDLPQAPLTGQRQGSRPSYTAAMRLSDHDRQAIRKITTELAGPQARVLLFGSRTRDDLRGGDIDLLVELPAITPQRLTLGDRLGVRLQRAIGLRKIDILVADPATPRSPVLAAARRDGIAL